MFICPAVPYHRRDERVRRLQDGTCSAKMIKESQLASLRERRSPVAIGGEVQRVDKMRKLIQCAESATIVGDLVADSLARRQTLWHASHSSHLFSWTTGDGLVVVILLTFALCFASKTCTNCVTYAVRSV